MSQPPRKDDRWIRRFPARSLHTTGPLDFHVFEGGHFYLDAHQADGSTR
jgi:surfactin synthase thioesterase subunit